MKVNVNTIIQNRFIAEYTEYEFSAKYKCKQINITSVHGHGKPKYSHLKRYDIRVTDIITDMVDVDTYGDFHTMKDAVRYALDGAGLLNK